MAEFSPSAQKPALHQRSLIPVGVICLVLSNQQITSNQSAVGLFMLHVSKLVIPVPGTWNLVFPSRLPASLDTTDTAGHSLLLEHRAGRYNKLRRYSSTSIFRAIISRHCTSSRYAETAKYVYTIPGLVITLGQNRRQVKELRTSTVDLAHSLAVWGWRWGPSNPPFLHLELSKCPCTSFNVLTLLIACVAHYA